MVLPWPFKVVGQRQAVIFRCQTWSKSPPLGRNFLKGWFTDLVQTRLQKDFRRIWQRNPAAIRWGRF